VKAYDSPFFAEHFPIFGFGNSLREKERACCPLLCSWIQTIQQEASGSPADAIHLFRTIKPFWQKWVRLPDDYEERYQQLIREAQSSDFTGTVNIRH
jgi:hypothetical protein